MSDPWIETTIVLSTAEAETQDGLFLRAAIVWTLEQLEESLMVLEQALETSRTACWRPGFDRRLWAVQALATQAGP